MENGPATRIKPGGGKSIIPSPLLAFPPSLDPESGGKSAKTNLCPLRTD